ncbi:calcium-binding protein [Streptomyces sp. NPDC001068]|uniref:calcium-binding protein n=1 Tax=Streptomyces sp. NPDC001068 TaxID=3364544 RepID=UPI00369C376C
MHIRTAAAAAAGTLAVLALSAPAAQADTHKGDTVFTSVTFSKSTLYLGASTAHGLTVTATVKDNSGIKNIYGGKLVSPAGRIAFPRSADCTRPSSTTMKCVFKYLLDPDGADYENLKNADAGTWHLDAEAAAKDGDYYGLTTSKTMKVKRYARLTATQAGPEPVAKGHALTVTGTLSRADWTGGGYDGFGAQHVALQFKKAGSSTYGTVKTVTTDGSGKLRTTVTAHSAGTWRWRFAGTGTTGAANATGDGVAVK